MTYFFLIPLICHFSLHLPQCSGHIDCSKLFYNKLKHYIQHLILHLIHLHMLNLNLVCYFYFLLVFVLASTKVGEVNKAGIFLPRTMANILSLIAVFAGSK